MRRIGRVWRRRSARGSGTRSDRAWRSSAHIFIDFQGLEPAGARSGQHVSSIITNHLVQDLPEIVVVKDAFAPKVKIPGEFPGRRFELFVNQESMQDRCSVLESQTSILRLLLPPEALESGLCGVLQTDRSDCEDARRRSRRDAGRKIENVNSKTCRIAHSCCSQITTCGPLRKPLLRIHPADPCDALSRRRLFAKHGQEARNRKRDKCPGQPQQETATAAQSSWERICHR